VDALAVAIGTSHGAYKFTSEPDRDVLAMNIIEEINERLPTTHLVMHGSSSVPKELVDTINQYGGEIRPTFGVPVREIQEGIKHGVRKVNVDTDLRLAATGAIRKAFAEDPSEFDPRYYLKPARAAMQEVVKARMQAFGQGGHAKDYDPISLPDMAVRYKEQGHQLTTA
jgi:fructose-bisphosphate aldolase class II